jgi:hypothetical protein
MAINMESVYGTSPLSDFCRASLIVGLLLAMGCNSDKESPTGAETSKQGAAAAKNTNATNADRGKPEANRLFKLTIEKYQTADAYSDEGEITLRYRVNGTLYVDSAPYQVRFRRGKTLDLDIYETQVQATDASIRAKIKGGDEPELSRQFLDAPLEEGLQWAAIIRDPLLHEAISNGLGRFPMAVELLLGPKPLDTFHDQKAFPRRLLDNEDIDGRTCFRLEITTSQGPFVLSIDAQSYLVRRVEFPVNDMAEKMTAESGAEEIHVTAEFRHAKFAVNSQSSQSESPLQPGPDDWVVTELILPPEPLPTNLLGKNIPAFQLQDINGQEFDTANWAGKTVILHWYVDHPSCKASLKLFNKTAQTFANDDQVAFFAVFATSTETSADQIEDLMVEWETSVPILRDSNAAGRDVFQIPALPAIIAIGNDGRLQIYELTLIPELDTLLGEAVTQLLAGKDLASEVMEKFEEARAAYAKQLKNGGKDRPDGF